MRSHRHRSRLRWGARVTILLVVAALIALIGGTSAMAADRWSDISDQTWINVYHVTAADAATVAAGYPDGTFKPNLAVTRGQFAKMAVDGLALGTANPAVPTFSDVPKTNTFFAWIEGGVDAGVINGFPDGTYHPNSSVSRQQANSILGSYLSQKELALRGHIAGALDNYASLSAWYTAEGAALLAQYADNTSVATVHKQYTAYLTARDVVQGSPSGGSVYLRPGSNLTRAQAVAMILRVKSVTFLTAVPTVTLLNPNSGPAAGGNTVVISGTNFTGAQNVKFGTVTATTFTINSSTQITVVAPPGTAGTIVDVTVTTPAGTSSTIGVANDYAYGFPTVTALNPAAGPAAGGNTVIITGTNFINVSTVKFGTTNATGFTVNSPTQITAIAPAGTVNTTVDVTVTTPAGISATSAASKYSYGIPTITVLNPAAGPAAGGNTVTITGTGFTGLSGASAVKFGNNNASSYTVDSPTQITAVAPAGTNGTTVDVTVTNPVGTSLMATMASKYSYGAPTVTALNPASGPAVGGNSVVITGTGFTGVSGATAVKFGLVNATSYTVNSPTQITAVAPAGTAGTTVDVTVTNPVGTSPTTGTGNDYAYGGPTVTALTPNGQFTTAAGTAVTLTGTGFVPGATVAFGSVAATSVVVVSPTQITCVSPAQAALGVVDVTVTTAAGTSPTTGLGNDYAYGAPTVTAVVPNGGSTGGGTAVTITGTGFVPGATVLFGGVGFPGTTVVVVSNTSITCFTPAHAAGTVDVTVTTAGGTSATPGGAENDFIYGLGVVSAANSTVGASPVSVVADGVTTSTITVTLKDASNNPVAGKTVTLAKTSGPGSPTVSAASGPSNASGVVTFTVKSTTAGADVFTATDTTDAVVITQTATVTFTAGPVSASQSTVVALPTSVVADGATTSTITVTLKDANNNPVSGKTVTLAKTSGPGTPNIGAASGPSDASGVVTFAVSSTTAGADVFTATDVTDSNLVITQTATVTFTPGPLDHFAFATITSPQATGVAFSITITAQDVNNNTVTGYTGTPALTLTETTGTPDIAPTNTTAFTAGVWTGNVTVTGVSTGVVIHATDVTPTGASNAFDVN
ncbi:MAG: IPT/TIG domain-containing protein [Actinobacteria bacterium]|nr:IPT/TIG domain-containing protein [Actinomycetota bacterium]